MLSHVAVAVLGLASCASASSVAPKVPIAAFTEWMCVGRKTPFDRSTARP
jgi:hypothetical protein